MDPSILCALFALYSLTHAKKLIRVSFFNSTEAEAFRKFSRKNNVDVWMCRTNSSDVVVTESEEDMMKSNFETEVLISDLEKAIKQNMDKNSLKRRKIRRLRNNDAPTGYFPTYDDIIKWLQYLHNELIFAQIRSIGKTNEGRDMHVLRIGTGPETKPAIFIMSGLHAREWLAPVTVIYFIDKLVKGQLSSQQRITALTEKFDWYFLVIANPDGYIYSFQSPETRSWRKTRSRQPGGAVGVDANRNFDIDFYSSAAIGYFHDFDYPGPFPFSEKCTANIRDFVLDCNMNGRIKLSYDVHTYSQFFLVPFAHDETKKSFDDHEVRRVAQLSNAALKKVNGREFKLGSPGEVWYEAPGTAMDWFKERAQVKYSYSLELFPEQRKNDPSFLGYIVEEKDIEPSGKEISEAILTAAENIQV